MNCKAVFGFNMNSEMHVYWRLQKLSDIDSNAEMAIDGFGEPIRQDRDAGITGKSQGGGVCLC